MAQETKPDEILVRLGHDGEPKSVNRAFAEAQLAKDPADRHVAWRSVERVESEDDNEFDTSTLPDSGTGTPADSGTDTGAAIPSSTSSSAGNVFPSADKPQSGKKDVAAGGNAGSASSTSGDPLTQY